MSQAAHSDERQDASLVWQQLGERVDALVAAWESGVPESLAEFLPAGPPAVRRLTLVEAIKIDLEYRWQTDSLRKLVEDYLQEFPELADGGVPCDVIYEEFHIRRQSGDSVTPQEYLARFPQRAEELARLFNIESQAHTTTQITRQRVPTFEAGQTIDDFDLLKALGKGAFACVFLARQKSMQRLVALKISLDRGFEPQTLAQLEHPHIVRVFDQRLVESSRLRLLYMQYISGGTLADVVAHVRQLPPSARSGRSLVEAVDQVLAGRDEQQPSDSLTRYRLQGMNWWQAVCWLGTRLASALAYSHERGVLHRDVKPANVLVGPDGQPKLADFNISFSKIDGATPAAYFGGSLAYMSPEQLEAFDPSHSRKPDELDGRADVYSLGVVLWELLVARRPFVDAGLKDQWAQALGRMTDARREGVPAEARAQLAAECPPMVVTTLLKCLEPNCEKRYATAGDLARELELCLQPRAYALLRDQSTWGSWAKHHPVLTTIGIGLVPNIVLCLLNIVYNVKFIIPELSTEAQKIFFSWQIAVVNVVSYTIGLGYVFYSRGALFKLVSRLADGEKVEPPPAHTMVSKCLTFGLAVAVLSAVLWTISGFVFPGWLYVGGGPESQLTSEHFGKFIISNLLSGMIAATQSYYVVTFLSLRYCFPWLLSARRGEMRDVDDLASVARWGRIFLGLTVSVPFLAILTLVRLNPHPFVIGTLGGLGLAGCALAYWLDLTIRGDLAALANTINPSGDALGGTDSMDSFLTGSRSR